MRVKQLLVIGLAALMLFSGPAAAQQADWQRPDYSSEHVDSTYIYEERMDVATHDRAEMSSLLGYYDDNGESTSAPATLNDSIDNPAVVRYDQVDTDAYDQFPRDSNDTALNASDYTTGGQNASKIAISQTDGKTGNGVTSVEVSASSMASGDVAYVENSQFNITNDAEKRVPLIGLNVDSLQSGSNVTVAFIDDDGDEKQFHVGSSFNASSDDVIADSTGNGYVTQERLNNLATDGSGDGTFDSIESYRITVEDADAQVTVFAIDAERKDTLTLGQQKTDTDGDDELETVTIEEVTSGAEVGLTGLDSMGSAFDDARIHHLGVLGLEWRASELADEDVRYDVGSADSYASYSNSIDAHERLLVISAIDLSHNGLELRMDQENVDERYKRLRMIEGAGDTDFDDLSNWNDVSGQISSEGDTLVLDDTIQPGDTYVVNRLTVHQDDEMDDIAPDTGTPDAASGGFWGNDMPGSGIINWIFAGIAGVVGSALAMFKMAGGSANGAA